MAAVVLQGSLHLAKQQLGVTAAAVNTFQHASYSSDLRPIKKPSLAQMRKGAGGRSSFNGVVATVFGCSGFLGRYVCNELGKHGTQLILPYRGDFLDMQRLKLVGDLGQVLFLPFELRDENAIRQAVKYSNVVVNLLGRDWETKNFKFEDVHIEGARRLARISREMGVEKFIHVSALNINPKPEPKMLLKGSGVLRTKFYGEQAVREEFPDAVILRPSIVYGEEDRFFMYHASPLSRTFKFYPVYKMGHGITKMPIHCNDVASAIYEAIKNPDTAGQIYQLVGPERFSLHDLVDWIMKETRAVAEDGFYITDLRFDPIAWAKLFVAEKLPGTPVGRMHRQTLEMEATTDVVDYALPTTIDLGVTPSKIEEHINWIVKPYRHGSHLEDDVDSYVKVDPPKPVV